MIWTLYCLISGAFALAIYRHLEPSTWAAPWWVVVIACALFGLAWPAWLIVLAWERFRG